jgi:hypothetical protein
MLWHVPTWERPVLIGDTRSGLDHYVTPADLERGNGHGVYLALCGETITANALTAPPSRVCRTCREWRIC